MSFVGFVRSFVCPVVCSGAFYGRLVAQIDARRARASVSSTLLDARALVAIMIVVVVVAVRSWLVDLIVD